MKRFLLFFVVLVGNDTCALFDTSALSFFDEGRLAAKPDKTIFDLEEEQERAGSQELFNATYALINDILMPSEIELTLPDPKTRVGRGIAFYTHNGSLTDVVTAWGSFCVAHQANTGNNNVKNLIEKYALCCFSKEKYAVTRVGSAYFCKDPVIQRENVRNPWVQAWHQKILVEWSLYCKEIGKNKVA